MFGRALGWGRAGAVISALLIVMSATAASAQIKLGPTVVPPKVFPMPQLTRPGGPSLTFPSLKPSITPSLSPTFKPVPTGPIVTAPVPLAPAPARVVRFRCEVAPNDQSCREPGTPDGGGSDDSNCSCSRDYCHLNNAGRRVCEKLR
jgi:hypothetical protein